MKNIIRFFFWIALGFSGVWLSGCAHCPAQQFTGRTDRPLAAVRFFASLDQAVERAGVRNAADYGVPGFPYLRTNRFLSSPRFTGAALASKRFSDTWISRLRERDIAARKLEIMNLPDAERQRLMKQSGVSGRLNGFYDLMVNHAEHLYTTDRRDPKFLTSVINCLTIPAEYSRFRRVIGLYPLAALPTLYLTDKAHDAFRARLALPPDEIPVSGRLMAFSPPETEFPSPDYPRRLFTGKTPDALGIISLTKTEIRNLALALAPCLTQDIADRYDEFGRISWNQGAIQIDGRRPTLYYYLSYAFINNRPAMQMNYTLWYSRREGPNTPWRERGPIDGVTIRLTLDRQGLPLLLDIMNTSGAYHFFAPREKSVAAIRAQSLGLNPLVPIWLPTLYGVQRLGVRLNSGWHQATHIAALDPIKDAAGYDLTPYEQLESLPVAPGQHQSMFTQEGLVKGSTRIEPYLLFSLGIPHVGSMRQRGHHPIALVGTAHFDDPELLNRAFTFH